MKKQKEVMSDANILRQQQITENSRSFDRCSKADLNWKKYRAQDKNLPALCKTSSGLQLKIETFLV